MNRFLLFVAFFFVQYFLFSQQRVVDSLLVKLHTATDDFKKIELLLKIADACPVEDNLKYSSAILDKAEALKPLTKNSTDLRQLSISKAKAYQFRAYYYQAKPYYNQQKQIDNLQKAGTIYVELKMWPEFDNVRGQITNSYLRSGEAFLQLQSLKEALEITARAGHKPGMAKYIYRLATFYAKINDTLNAIKYAEKGIDLEKEINDPARIARGLYLGGGFYNEIRKPKKAIAYFDEALKKYNAAHDSTMIVNCLIGIAEAQDLLNDYTNAKNTLNHAYEYAACLPKLTFKDLEVANELGELAYRNDLPEVAIGYFKAGLTESTNRNYPGGIATENFNLAKTYFKLKDYGLAKQHGTLALNFMQQFAGTEQVMKTEEILYQADSALGDYRNSFFHFKAFTLLKNKLSLEDIKKAGMKEELENNFRLEKEKQNAIATEEINHNKFLKNSFITGFLVVLILAAVILRSYLAKKTYSQELSLKNNEITKQKHEVEEKQKEILDSITYAKRLQQAILPPQDLIDQYFPDNFILYKPKDIVAGDFYWAQKINDLLFIAAADSTGHGVPGALVSVVCSNALNRAVKEFKLTETGKILDQARTLIIETFEKSASDVKDGMDISLLSIDLKTKNISWSGANNPLWYICDNELMEIKADKQPVGKTDHAKPFTTHQIEYTQHTTFYLFTDGLADQFGGPKGKKFKYKQFSELLVSTSNLSQAQKSQTIEQNFLSWKGDLEQVDDVCVIGIRI